MYMGENKWKFYRDKLGWAFYPLALVGAMFLIVLEFARWLLGAKK